MDQNGGNETRGHGKEKKGVKPEKKWLPKSCPRDRQLGISHTARAARWIQKDKPSIGMHDAGEHLGPF